MKIKTRVRCTFDIEYEDKNDDISYTKRNILMMSLAEFAEHETSDSIQEISILEIEKL